MNIRFTRTITLPCIRLIVGTYEGDECELDMEVQSIFEEGQLYEGVEFDQETPKSVRIWLRDDFVALNVPRDCFEAYE